MENYEMEKDLLEDLENDPLLNGLCEWLRDNQPKMQILNVRRYYEMLIAKAAFDDVLKKNWDSEPSTVELNPAFACASLRAEVDSFEVTDIDAFSLLLSKADNFEVVPLTNGKLRLAFMFYHMMKTVA